MATIGELTLNDIGIARVRTEYEGATIEGLVSGLDLDITTQERKTWSAERGIPTITVAVNLRLGNIDLQYLDRDHACEVIA